MMLAICSTSASTAVARSFAAAIAVPTKQENTTICRISLSAIASTMERGTRWLTNSVSDSVDETWAAPPFGSARPTPGWNRCTITSPSVSDTSEAKMNQAIVLPPTRPMAAAPSICAMPATSVENTSGAMIILIRRRKIGGDESEPCRSATRAVAARATRGNQDPRLCRRASPRPAKVRRCGSSCLQLAKPSLAT